MEKVKVAIVGLGSRGKDAYAKTAHLFPKEMEIVAIADIIPEKVEVVAKEYGIPTDCCYESAEQLLKEEKLADVLFICTLDKQHYNHAIPALEKGYHLLLEKPISPDKEECKKIVEAANRHQRHVVVCHVLRYTPFFQKLKEIISSGKIGDVVSIQAIENVGYWHQAHSFVRGNWRNAEETSPMILQKSCHDMDILLWLSGKGCSRVSSYGSLRLFRAENAPSGSSKRCVEDCAIQKDCPFDAERFYLTDGVLAGKTDWPINVLSVVPTEESIREAIKIGPYGRCVYHCDNDVVDHQVVNLELNDGSTISFTMCAFTNAGHRYVKIMGTKGDIDANMDTNIIDVCEFGKDHELIDVTKLSDDFSGHGGGDNRMIGDLLSVIRGDSDSVALTSVDQSAESHFVALAAEYSRTHGGESILLKDFIDA